MPMPTDDELDTIQRNLNSLRGLGLADSQLIMLCLAELLAANEGVPIGKRIPLLSLLQSRSRGRTPETEEEPNG